MQTFDGELEKLINAALVDKEVALSYASNRTNLLLRLETQSGSAADQEPTPSGRTRLYQAFSDARRRSEAAAAV
jgi:hypothetical protein